VSISAPRYVQGSVPRVGRPSRVLAIVEREFRRRATWGPIFAVALTWFIVVLEVVVTVYFATVIGGSVSAAFESPYGSVIWVLLLLIVTATVGAGSLADDIGSRAITLYLSRPLRISDYLGAKASAVGAWLVIAGVGPGCVAAAVTAALGYVSVSEALAAAAGCVAVGLVLAIFFTGIALALSSLTRKSLYAGVAIFGTVLSVTVSVGVVWGITGNGTLLYADLLADVQSIAEAAFGQPSPYPTDPVASAIVLVLTGCVLALLAWWRLSRIEVVGE